MELGVFVISGNFLRPCPSFEAIASSLLTVASAPVSVVVTGVSSIEICVFRLDEYVSLLRFRYLLVSGCFLELTPSYSSSGLASSFPPRRRQLSIPLDLELMSFTPCALGPSGNRDFITRFNPSLLFGADCALPSSVGPVCAFDAFSPSGGTGLDCVVPVLAADAVSAPRGKRELITRFVPRLRFSSEVGTVCSAVCDCVFGSEFAAVSGSFSVEFKGELTTPIESGGDRSEVGFSGARVCVEVVPLAKPVFAAEFYR